MATLKQRIENHPAVLFLGALIVGFLAGIGAYEGIMAMTDRSPVSNSRIAELESLEATSKAGGFRMSPIRNGFDRHGCDLGSSLDKNVPEDCELACKTSENCFAWALDVDDKQCWLKGIPPEKPRDGFASGIKIHK